MIRMARVHVCAIALAASTVLGVHAAQAQVHVIEVITDKDSRNKYPTGSKPAINFKADEQIILRISARKRKTKSR